MITISVADTKTYVRQLLDEIGLDESEFATIDGTTEYDDTEIDTLVEGRAIEALRFVHGNADPSLVDWTLTELDTENDDFEYLTDFVSSYSVGHAVLTDCLRLKSVALSSWVRPVSFEDFIETDDPEASKLRNQYTTGTPDRPRVMVQRDRYLPEVGEGSYYGDSGFELWLCSSEDGTDTLNIYQVADQSTASTGYNISDRLEEAFIYYLAGLVCQSLGDERQAGFFQQAVELMGRKTETQ